MSRIGWLPSYNWHLVIVALMAIAVITTVIQFNYRSVQRLYTSSHVRQMATGLNFLEKTYPDQQALQQEVIKIFTTRAGLSLSFNQEMANSGYTHYTISSNSAVKINLESAKKLANIIRTIKNYPADYELIERQNGIYHILFINTEQNLFKGSANN